MKVLLDECIPRKLKYALPDHDCQTVPDVGLAGKKNSALLSLAEGDGFDVAIVILRAKSNRLDDSLPLMPECTEAIRTIQCGRVVRIAM